jgi:small subunit ribosomal protein S9
VRLFTARPLDEQIGRITVNEKPYTEYFSTPELQQTVEASLNKMKSLNRFEVTARVSGGGIKSQAEAIRHGLARVLVLFNPDFRKKLKRANFLRRDPRMKERKKYGLKKARRAPQWAKR